MPSIPTPSAPRGEPNVAALLTLFVPGMGHVYLGRLGFAIAAFVLVEGLYALGFLLSDGLVFAFLDPELRSPLAILLTPEVGNLGALLLHKRHVGWGPDDPVPWPERIALGGTLTALSGMLNVCLVVRAHLDARLGAHERARGPSPALLVACAWALPGLGHVLQGRRLRGFVVFALLCGLFLLGSSLAELSNLSRERHFFYWSGQFLLGLPALVLELLEGGRLVSGPIRYADAGLLFGCVAGLLNVLAMLDVYGCAEARLLGADLGADEELEIELVDDGSPA